MSLGYKYEILHPVSSTLFMGAVQYSTVLNSKTPGLCFLAKIFQGAPILPKMQPSHKTLLPPTAPTPTPHTHTHKCHILTWASVMKHVKVSL